MLEISSSIIQFRGVDWMFGSSPDLVAMSKTRFTEAEIRRAIKGVLAGGAEITSVEIWPDGRISVTVKEDNGKTHTQMDPEDDPEV